MTDHGNTLLPGLRGLLGRLGLPLPAEQRALGRWFGFMARPARDQGDTGALERKHNPLLNGALGKSKGDKAP